MLDSEGLMRGIAVDFGCGPGLFASSLAELGFDVIGVDFSEEMLSIARSNPKVRKQIIDERLTLVEADWDAYCGGQASESLHLISALGFVYYLEDLEDFVSECSRLLRPGAHMLVSFRNSEFHRGSNDFVDQLQFIFDHLDRTALHAWFEALNAALERPMAPPLDPNQVPQLSLSSHSPIDSCKLGARHSLTTISVEGVHGHLLHPALDKDALSVLVDVLSLPLESIPGGDLRWYSHFLVLYRKEEERG